MARCFIREKNGKTNIGQLVNGGALFVEIDRADKKLMDIVNDVLENDKDISSIVSYRRKQKEDATRSGV